MVASIVLGKRVPKNTNNPNGWEDIDGREYSLGDKPMVLCLGGDGTTDGRSANAMAKYAEQLLGIVNLPAEEADVELVSAYLTNSNREELYFSRIYHLNTSEDDHQYTNDEINPPYIDQFYEEYFEKLLFDNKGLPLPVKEVKKSLRNINIFAFCHGHYIVSKLEEKLKANMLSNGYSNNETKDILKQIAIVAIVPQADLTKTAFTQVAFGAIDDYHFSNDDAMELTSHYELDCNTQSYIGIVERPLESKPGNSKLYILDNLLDYNDEEDRFKVWLGRETEEMHKVSSYIDLDYANEFGSKSAEGKDFAQLIAKALQASVSNSCYSAKKEKPHSFSLSEIANSQKLYYRQGPAADNGQYQNLNMLNICKMAEIKGRKVDNNVYRMMHMQQIHHQIENVGINQVLQDASPYWKAYALLEANLRNLPTDVKMREEDKKFVDNEIWECIKMSESSKENNLHKALQRKTAAQKFVKMSEVPLDFGSFDKAVVEARKNTNVKRMLMTASCRV